MDDHASFPTCTLKVNLEDCEDCVVKLEKSLAKVYGVHGVDVDAEKGLVRVSGKVDPRKLIRKIEQKTEKKAELLSYGDPIMTSQNEDCMEMQKKKAIYLDKDDHDFDDYVTTKRYEDFECRDSNCRCEEKKPVMRGNHYVPKVKLHPPNPYRSHPPPNPYRFPPPNPYGFPSAPPNLQYPPPNPYGRPMVPQYDHGGGGRYPPYNPHRFSPPNTHRFSPSPPNLHYPRYYGRPVVPQYDSSGYCLVCGGSDHDVSCMQPLLPPLPPFDHYGARHMPASNDFTQFFSDENVVGCTVM